MYNRSAIYYDEIYSFKNYKEESEKLDRIIKRFKKSPGNDLLDVACGTGNHISFLKQHYRVEGLDLNASMLEIARHKHPDVVFHKCDMTGFHLGRTYDAVVCLFSAIGHVKTVQKLNNALRSMSRHLKPGGLVIIEPWYSRKDWKTDSIHSNFVNEPDLKIARISISGLKGKMSINRMHYLVGKPKGIEYFVENLEMGLFSKSDYLRAFHQAGLRVHHDPEGLIGRGLYIGVSPLD